MHIAVIVSHAVAMFGAVLPVVTVQGINPRTVYVDVVVVPVEPAAPIIPAGCPPAKCVSGTKYKSRRDETAGDVSGISEIVGWVLRIRPATVNNSRIVIRNVDRLGVCRLDGDDLSTLFLSP